MIEQIKKALEKATQGDWHLFEDHEGELAVMVKDIQTAGRSVSVFGIDPELNYSIEDIELVTNAPEWLRYLIGEVERLKEIDERESEITIQIHFQNHYFREKYKELQKALEQAKSSVLDIDKVVKTAVAHGETLHYLLLSDELTRIADAADQALCVNGRSHKKDALHGNG